ncbi:Z1 domain-containing protein [Cryobacterium arcticum]|uniref:Alpha-1,4 polygalactosaminidase n=1 Tax=Cryobacterium arcticum TaxID=670052 RepID=A0A317ZVV1_9MICO|nr:Z1 domain-containing protein [Cryobacterium arcticum]PXA68297.1 alpha-1,4 polygalactosaminidase [Cryobacterium arcticum]
MSEESIAEVVADIAVGVRGGLSIDGAVDRLRRWVPNDVLAKARIDFETSVGLIRKMDDPGVLLSMETRKNSWYPGPQPTDFFWPPLRIELEHSLGESPVIGIDSASSVVLSAMRAPGVPEFSTRGLVLGYVQSGKTTNFISVIAKAADSGYRIFVVLSGTTENLRSQTQSRIDQSLGSQAWYKLTSMDSDFYEAKENAAALLSGTDLRFIAVVKKNPARLRRLRDWLAAAGPVQLANNPILLIDDEADQASIDVGPRGRASRINGLMKEILRKPKAAYVAYTATPFANLLINANDPHDFYPRDFVVPLPRPVGYFGAEELFGLPEKTRPEDSDSDGLNVIRTIPDDEAAVIRPPSGKGAVYGWDPTVDRSLGQAIEWFILATAARRLRGTGNVHSTMLIHTSMLAEAHVRVAGAVSQKIRALVKSLETDDREALGRLETIWNSEGEKLPSSLFDYRFFSFEEIRPLLGSVARQVRTVVDNYLSTDRLAYDDEIPSVSVVIGGNTLSRGLTLEGLVSSYFVRSASAYDTLLQMGRWFGYRKGYEDLVRIWMTSELHEWFMDLSMVEADIRLEISRFEAEHLTPSEVAVRIRSHPSMAITAAAKMRHAVRAQMSFSEKRPQTILFNTEDKAWLQGNIDSVRRFVGGLLQSGFEESTFGKDRRGFRNVHARDLLEFLTDYEFHANSQSVKSKLLVDYIENENRADSLLNWNIVFMERPDSESSMLDLGLNDDVRLLRRSRLNLANPRIANVKSVVSTIDRVADMDWSYAEIQAELAQKSQKLTDANLLAIRDDVLGPQGLLCIYPIDKDSQPQLPWDENSARSPLGAALDVIGIALFFPRARAKHSEVEYWSADLSAETFESAEDEIEQINKADTLDDGILATQSVKL